MVQDINIGKISEELNLKLDIDGGNATGETQSFVKSSVETDLNDKVTLNTEQTITSKKTFTISPLVPTPDNEASGKEVVNAEWCKENAGGGKDLNTGDKIYDWIGTTQEYEAQQIETLHPEYLCYITDDSNELTLAKRDLSNLDETGQAKFDAKANVDLSNLSTTGEAKLKSNIQLVNELPANPEQGVLYCIPEA